MRKEARHNNAIVKYDISLSTMVDKISAEYLGTNQAEYIYNGSYNESLKGYEASYIYERVSGETRSYKRIYKVYLDNTPCLFGSYLSGVRDITNKRDYPLDNNITPSDIISNQDGVFVSSGFNIYQIPNKNAIPRKIAFSLSPFSWQVLTLRHSKGSASNSLIHYNGRIYFSDKRGTGYFKDHVTDVVIIDQGIDNLDFFICNNSLFALTEHRIYTITDNKLDLYFDKSNSGDRWRYSTCYKESLAIMHHTGDGYVLELFNTVTKKVTKYNLTGFKKGLSSSGYKFVRSINNQLYFILNEGVYSNGYIKYSVTSLYQLEIHGSSCRIIKTIYENRQTDSAYTHMFCMDNMMFITSARFVLGEQGLNYFRIFEIKPNGSVQEVIFTAPPVSSNISGGIAVKGNRLYVGNINGIYFIDIRLNKTYIPCLLTQHGRLIVPQGSSLYFSGIGDFYNWSYAGDSDALFVEIGYKDGGNIIYAAIVYDSIIVFKDNGSIYRLLGSYPNWIVTKLGETDSILSRAAVFGSQLLLGTSQSVKMISTTQNFGDFLLQDYQESINDKKVIDISICRQKDTIRFCAENFVFEYSSSTKGFLVYQKARFNQCFEFYDNRSYTQYALDSNGMLLKENKNRRNRLEFALKNIITNRGIIIKSVCINTNNLIKNKSLNITFENKTYNFILKSGKIKHKFFITKRLKSLQPKISYEGDFIINNIFIEYAVIGG